MRQVRASGKSSTNGPKRRAKRGSLVAREKPPETLPRDERMAARISADTDELLAAVVEYLIQGGVTRPHICAALLAMEQRVRAGRRAGSWAAGMSTFVHKLSAAYEAWWTDPTFLDGAGRPIPLPVRAIGRRPSIERLLSAEFSKSELPLAIDALGASPSVDSDDDQNWCARDAALILSADGELSSRRAVGLVKGLLSTIHTNNSIALPGHGLFERTVMSSSLPLRLVPSLKREAHEQLGQALFAMQKLFRNAELRPGTRSRTEVGVEVFVYELPICDDAPKKKQRGRSGRRT
jgi:hypothetical protein